MKILLPFALLIGVACVMPGSHTKVKLPEAVPAKTTDTSSFTRECHYIDSLTSVIEARLSK